MKIAIGIPSYDRDDVLISTINAALHQSRPADEVIVIDQTKDHTPEVKRKLGDWAKTGKILYEFQDRPSLPAARNLALSVTKCDLIIFIDDDVELPDDFVSKHERNFISDPTVQAVAGGLDQRLGWPSRKSPASWPRVLDYRYLFLGGRQRVEGIANFPGGNHCIKVQAAIALGGYDERLKGVALREESDLALRLYSAGGKIVFDPDARLLHLAAPTGGCRRKSPLDMAAARSNLFFAFKHLRKIKLQIFNEIWFSVRLGVLNKTNIKNPLYMALCGVHFIYLLVEIPVSILFGRTTARF
jgi:glycosyltransferase involved in cell wall biosynthesis